MDDETIEEKIKDLRSQIFYVTRFINFQVYLTDEWREAETKLEQLNKELEELEALPDMERKEK